MKIVEIVGGLGNQMFQFAFHLSLIAKFPTHDHRIYLGRFSQATDNLGYQLENTYNIRPKQIDESFVSEKFSCMPSRIYRILQTVYPCWRGFFLERKFRYDPAALFNYPNKDVYYRGLWQDSRYFSDIQQTVRKAFTFRSSESIDLNSHFKNERKGPIIGIHVRRGDYVSNPKYHKILGDICTEAYYRSAVNSALSRISDASLLVFSDDINWVKNNYHFLNNHNTGFVSNNNGTSSSADMMLMSKCDHNIIANSSFSWWGAWLNPNPQKLVIAPDRWFRNNPWLEDNHIIPPDWLKVATR